LLYDGELPDLSGKHVLFHLYNSTESYLLQDISFERYDGRVFVQGRMSKGLAESVWTRGLQASLAWENIKSYLIFDTPEEYSIREEKWKKWKKSQEIEKVAKEPQKKWIGRLLRRKNQ
jgi:hypothetical protein